MPDNDPADKFGYEITIWTGYRAKSGTTSKVALVMSGDDGDSEPRTLFVRETPVFQRGGINSFLLTTKLSLGSLSSIRFAY